MEKNRAYRNKWFRQIVLLGPIAVNAIVALTGVQNESTRPIFRLPLGLQRSSGWQRKLGYLTSTVSTLRPC